MRTVLVLVALLVAAGAAQAQDRKKSAGEDLKASILKEVDRRLEAHEARLLEEIKDLLKSHFSRGEKAGPKGDWKKDDDDDDRDEGKKGHDKAKKNRDDDEDEDDDDRDEGKKGHGKGKMKKVFSTFSSSSCCGGGLSTAGSGGCGGGSSHFT